MLQRGKLLVFLCTGLIVVYGVSAAFYGRVIEKDQTLPALDVFMESLKHISDEYVEPPEMSKVQEGAMRGLIDALDPYSAYLTKEEMLAVEKNTADAADIGVVLSKRADIIYVVAARRDGPAANAGIRPGDYIVAVDDQNVESRSIVEVESLLRGAPGSTVKVAVFRGSETKPIELKPVRTKPVPVAVGSQLRDDGIGVIEISSLASQAPEQIRVKVQSLLSAGAKQLILDLRDCADGAPASGSELANLFLSRGTLYTIRGRGGEVLEEIKADAAKHITDAPMVVLINSASAGAAEIAAGALQGNRRATVVGEKSFGMGSTQKRINLTSGAVLLLSTAKYYTPDGKMIEDDESFSETGIKPDLDAPDRDRLQDLLVESYFDVQEDAAKYGQLREKIKQEQLQKAVEVLVKG